MSTCNVTSHFVILREYDNYLSLLLLLQIRCQGISCQFQQNSAPIIHQRRTSILHWPSWTSPTETCHLSFPEQYMAKPHCYHCRWWGPLRSAVGPSFSANIFPDSYTTIYFSIIFHTGTNNNSNHFHETWHNKRAPHEKHQDHSAVT